MLLREETPLEGPLNLWNFDVIERITESCNVLDEVHQQTKEYWYLRKQNSKWMHPISLMFPKPLI